MKSQLEKPAAKTVQGTARRRYQAPVLRCFGLITELTNTAVGSCHDDGVSCDPPPANMYPNNPA